MTVANQEQHDAWNGESGRRWVADADRRDVVLAPVGDVLLDRAGLCTGESVLDVGCGCGATTIAAGAAVAPGSATGLDLSAPMLEVARQRARGTGVSFVRADAQTYSLDPYRFDVVISRFGTMFFDDPVAAFANLAAATAGRLCIATWQPLAANGWLSVPGAALLQYGSLPDTSPRTPGMFAQSDPEIVDGVLRAAGWRVIEIEPVELSLRLGADAAEATHYLQGTGIARSVLETIAEADRPRAIAAVTEVLAAHESADGVSLPAGIHLIRAVPAVC